MAATSPSLPDKYRADDVGGKTTGSSRPTVYFSDHSRFTQIHKHSDNIGWHAPPHAMRFFGNVSEAEANRLRSREAQQAVRGRAGRNEALTFPAGDDDPNGRLFEVKEIDEGQFSTHLSRAKFVAVTDKLEQTELVNEIRSRSTTKQKDPRTDEWYFV